jgi:hypothetical protein
MTEYSTFSEASNEDSFSITLYSSFCISSSKIDSKTTLYSSQRIFSSQSTSIISWVFFSSRIILLDSINSSIS